MIISPQHFTNMDTPNRLFNRYCLIDLPGCCRILLSRSDTRDAVFVDLHKSNNLYFIAGSASVSSGSIMSRITMKPQLLSELLHQRIGHHGPTHLNILVKHSTGLPAQLTSGLQPMHSYHACNDGKIQRAPMGPTSDTAPIVSATRFHLDFGFIRASSNDFGVTKGPHVVTSYNGNNTYLLIADATQCYSWVFYQPSKSPHVFLSWNVFLPFMASKKVPDSSVWTRVVNFGALLNCELLRTHQVILLNQQALTRHDRNTKWNVSMARLSSWLDASYTVLDYQQNYGRLCLYTHYISRTGCIIGPLERHLIRAGQE
jgi:hypothetical protein